MDEALIADEDREPDWLRFFGGARDAESIHERLSTVFFVDDEDWRVWLDSLEIEQKRLRLSRSRKALFERETPLESLNAVDRLGADVLRLPEFACDRPDAPVAKRRRLHGPVNNLLNVRTFNMDHDFVRFDKVRPDYYLSDSEDENSLSLRVASALISHDPDEDAHPYGLSRNGREVLDIVADDAAIIENYDGAVVPEVPQSKQVPSISSDRTNQTNPKNAKTNQRERILAAFASSGLNVLSDLSIRDAQNQRCWSELYDASSDSSCHESCSETDETERNDSADDLNLMQRFLHPVASAFVPPTLPTVSRETLQQYPLPVLSREDDEVAIALRDLQKKYRKDWRAFRTILYVQRRFLRVVKREKRILQRYWHAFACSRLRTYWENGTIGSRNVRVALRNFRASVRQLWQQAREHACRHEGKCKCKTLHEHMERAFQLDLDLEWRDCSHVRADDLLSAPVDSDDDEDRTFFGREASGNAPTDVSLRALRRDFSDRLKRRVLERQQPREEFFSEEQDWDDHYSDDFDTSGYASNDDDCFETDMSSEECHSS